MNTQKWLLCLLLGFFISANALASTNGLALHGVDYAPSHYPQGDLRNNESQANVYAELKQLHDAGFNMVRLYGNNAVTWLAVIDAANQLGMQVVYQVALCESNARNQCVNSHPPTTYGQIETAALSQLQNIINAAGQTAFKKAVKLVIVGNEILWQDEKKTNAAKIVGSINKVKTLLDNSNLSSIPLTVSLQADVWVQSNLPGRKSIAAALPAGSPIAINVYPFQWMATVTESMDPSYVHSVPYYVTSIKTQYGRPVIISETGWASKGKYVDGNNHATGSVKDAAAFYPKVYSYATQNSIPTLVFMAYDTPTKSLSNSNMSSEDFYGAFNDECQLKGKTFVPNQSYKKAPACNNKQSLFTFVGMSPSGQKPFTITVQRGSKKTPEIYTITVPTENRANAQTTPWPTIVLQVGDKVTLKGSHNNSCTNTVKSVALTSHRGGSWQSQHPNGCTASNWPDNSQTIFLPANF
jgi:exo-beta-1,3-glucanase (GH17 family)